MQSVGRNSQTSDMPGNKNERRDESCKCKGGGAPFGRHFIHHDWCVRCKVDCSSTLKARMQMERQGILCLKVISSDCTLLCRFPWSQILNTYPPTFFKLEKNGHAFYISAEEAGLSNVLHNNKTENSTAWMEVWVQEQIWKLIIIRAEVFA